MKVLITGHRKFKLEFYNTTWIQTAIKDVLCRLKEKHGYIRGYSGMASGVDLWFCTSCGGEEIPFVACIPFEEQDKTMSAGDSAFREILIKEFAAEIRYVKNSWMVEECDMGIVVWDGNKGGTHNVLQQLVEKKKPFVWINPVAEKIWYCE